MRARTPILVALAAVAALSACRAGFRITRYRDNATLYAAGLREYERGKWPNAILAFEKLTNDLPARDTLLPRAYWYLAHAHGKQKEHLLAAQGFTRLYESFPDDTIADDAAFAAGRSYRRLWRKPTLDPTYGEAAMATFNTLLGLFPSSEHADSARAEILDLENWFATKNYNTGRYYFRRKAYESGNIYLKTVLERWPHVPMARDAMILLADSYRLTRYREELAETCTQLRTNYPGDAAVDKPCAGVVMNQAKADSTIAASKPPVTP
jgi:outer membrane assembly lipoprotein YfiO